MTPYRFSLIGQPSVKNALLKLCWGAVCWCALTASVHAAALTNVVSGTCVGDVTLVATNDCGWTFAVERLPQTEAAVDELVIRMSRASEDTPPPFAIRFSVPQEDIHFIWHAGAEDLRLPPAWHPGQVSTLASGMPLLTLLDANDRNRLSFAASESVLAVRCRAGLKETDCTVPCEMRFFEQATAPMRAYAVRVRLDRRNRRWDRTVEDLSDWIARTGAYVPMRVPESAREPLYSTWYAFTQDVSAEKIEDEARRAAALGMKTLILDDGWQTDEKGRAYERCGDLTVSKLKFPDGMAAHVKRVQACGIKYMAWFAVPFVGYKSPVHAQFKGKFLKEQPTVYCSVLDPRFPEVRAYLVEMFARAQTEWGLDGFKFDYIGQFTFERDKDTDEEIDPARAENYAGRDYKSLPDAVDALMAAILARLRAVNPDVLIEYRQPYVSPGIRRFGNMIRAIDCPGEMQKNIIRTAMLRLTSGETAVHSDMLEWHVGDTPERAAKTILASLFSTIQYSVVLSRQRAENLRMLKHWIGFTLQHRETLLKGRLTAHHPESHYPVLEAETEAERIAVAYNDLAVVPVADSRPTFVVNATGARGVLVDLPRAASVAVYDTFGSLVGVKTSPAGISRLDVPVSGYAQFYGMGTETAVWQRAIDASSAAGGGSVTVPAGRHTVGSLFLKNGVTLVLEKGCVLEGSARIGDYPGIPLQYAEYPEPWQALVASVGQTNVAVTGAGTISGNGPKFPLGTRLGRPRGMLLYRCRDVRLSEFRLFDLASWSCYIKECDGVTVRRVTIDAHGNNNNDGFDIDARNVLVEHCDIDSDDDAIVLKSDNPDFFCENVEVRDCVARSDCNIIKFGTASHGGFRNISIHDIRTEASRRHTIKPPRPAGTKSWREETWPGSPVESVPLGGIAIECVDGGLCENITLRNIDIAACSVPIFIRGGQRRQRYYGNVLPLSVPFGRYSILRNVTIENVRARAFCWTASSITGVSGLRLSNIVLRNVTIDVPGAGEAGRVEIGVPVPEKANDHPESNMFDSRMLPAYGFYIRHADGVTFDRVTVNVRGSEVRPEILTDDVTGFVRRSEK